VRRARLGDIRRVSEITGHLLEGEFAVDSSRGDDVLDGETVGQGVSVMVDDLLTDDGASALPAPPAGNTKSRYTSHLDGDQPIAYGSMI
jgi:hypothetical protein